MIAATDPQEFIPGGRQQVLRHPGPLESYQSSKHSPFDNFLLQRLEKVSLDENEDSEWWIVRKSPQPTSKKISTGYKTDPCNKNLPLFEGNSSECTEYNFEDSWNKKNLDISGKFSKNFDVNNSKIGINRIDCSKSFSYLNKSFMSTNVNTTNKIKYADETGYMEEELYVKGNTVIWSKGLIGEDDTTTNTRVTLCSYSSYYPIRQALWCTFYCEMPIFDPNCAEIQTNPNEPTGEPLNCVCTIDVQNIRVFANTSEDFICTPPFIVKKAWSCKFGLVLEKQIQDKSEISPIFFSLTHPLDDIRPVSLSHNGLTLIEEQGFKIVFTSENPSICVMYDINLGRHIVFKISKLKRELWLEISQKLGQSDISSSNKLKNKLSPFDTTRNITSQVFLSHFNSRATSASSTIPSRSQSPMISLSRCHTPTMSPLLSGSPWLLKNSRLPNLFRSVDAEVGIKMDYTQDESILTNHCNLTPYLSFEYLWSDIANGSIENIEIGGATKVFICDDFVGQNYLCYLQPSKFQLSLVKADFSCEIYTFGMLTSISALDAVPVPNLHLIAIFEHSGNVVLYSGLTIVGKLHIGGVLVQHVPSPCVMRHNVNQFNSPFPRRSSLLSTCATPLSDPHFDEHLLSPVLPYNRKTMVNIRHHYISTGGNKQSKLNGLRDAIGDKITLQYSDGTYYRITLPKLTSSPLIESCLNALSQTLPKTSLITLLTRWYSVRNSPGPVNLTYDAEWNMFSDLMFELLGYEEESIYDIPQDLSDAPSTSAKRQRPNSSGTDADWFKLINSNEQSNYWHAVSGILNLQKPMNNQCKNFDSKNFQINSNSVLFNQIRVIHFTLHLLYEDLKLNVYRSGDLKYLGKFLCKLSKDLGLNDYLIYYYKDFPETYIYHNQSYKQMIQLDMKNVTVWPLMSEKPIGVFQYLYKILKKEELGPYPYIKNLNERSKDLIQLCGIYIKGILEPEKEITFNSLLKQITPFNHKMEILSTPKSKVVANNQKPIEEQVVLQIVELGITSRDMDSFPIAIKLLLHEALFKCRENPPSDWPASAYNLLQRNDLAAQKEMLLRDKIENSLNLSAQLNLQEFSVNMKQVDKVQEDGMDEIDSPLMKLRFPEDHRVMEVRRLLQSSKPVPIVLVQRPDVLDHDFIEEQEKHLYAICTRTMALPVGRGMFTMRTVSPVITEPLVTPNLCLTGKAPPRGTTVELTHIDTPQNMNLWPLFHNGVANGLRITPEAKNIDTSWIIFNKPKNSSEGSMEHAGFLMGLGLNGHLKNLAVLNTFEYLVKVNEMISVGVLLGLATAFRGTANKDLTKMISLHVEALLPPTSMELDIPQNLQVAGLLGVGLVYQDTAHRHMTEVLLSEIGRPPGPEMENSVDRESYSLAAGLALGFVTLRQGDRPSGMSDLYVPDTLHYYMVGGNKRPLTGAQMDRYKVPSFQIREGNCVNLDVTAPGATLALGLMYLRTGNKAVADWMAPPETQYLLDFVRPDFLMLRILSRALILWDEILPEKEWIENQVPKTIRPYCMVKPNDELDVDYEAMNQAYCNIIAGACFAMGLKFAGSADQEAFSTLLEFCHMFISLTGKSIAELAGKPTIETCLNVVLLSVSMVMAGTGNLDIMRIVRHLRKRVGVASSSIVTYGSHLAVHMALGLLFLGGGRFTLSNSPSSVAALICAFYPKFPTHSNDNRYHLQAFRHLYVLAVEPRLVIPKDVLSGKMCYAKLNIVRLDGSSYKAMAPILLPDLNILYKVCFEDERYWTVTFERGRNFDQLIKILKHQGCIEVKQRVGCLNYKEDKTGYHFELAKTTNKSIPWYPHPKMINSFTSDSTIWQFTHHFLMRTHKNETSERENKLNQMICKMTYDAVVHDKIFVIHIFCSLLRTIRNLSSLPNTLNVWQFKLFLEFSNIFSSDLISSETTYALKTEFIAVLNSWDTELKFPLSSYLNGLFAENNMEALKKLALYVTFYDIPFGSEVCSNDVYKLLCELENLNCSGDTVNRILRIKNVSL